MILKVALLIKILMALAAGFGIVWLLRKHCAKKYAILLACCAMLIGALLGQKATALVPPLTDTVTITALGEKNPKATNPEVFLAGYQVDGEFHEVDGVTDGKWFWNGTRYMWRPETDSRQPDGTTRTIQVEVPVGTNRTVNFSENTWSGFVSVTYAGKEQTIDLYAEKSGTKTVTIPSSEKIDLICNQIRYLAAYAIVLLLLSALVTLFAVQYTAKSGRLKTWIGGNKAVIVIGAIALVQLLFAFHYAGVDCFWYDELYEIAWTVSSENLFTRAFRGTAPLPFFGVFMGIWYQIAPYGERWLLLPMEIGTALGVFFVGMAGKELHSNYVGIVSALLTAVSSNILTQCTYEIRNYGFYFFGSALLLFLFLRHIRRRKDESWKSIIGMGFAMIFFANMHHHAVFYCVLLCVVDYVFLIHSDKIKLKPFVRMMVPYAMAAISYIPTLIYVFLGDKAGDIAGQQHTSTMSVSTVKKLFAYFSSDSEYVQYIFWIGLASVLVVAGYELFSNRKAADTQILKLAIPALWLLFVVTFFIVFALFAQERGISTLWSLRYFVGIMPCFFLVSAMGCYYLSSFSRKCMKGDPRAFALVSVLLCLLVLPSPISLMSSKAQTVRQPYRQAADWLYTQGNYIYNDKTLVISMDRTASVELGWEEYYLTQQGRRDPINLQRESSISSDDLQSYNRVYVQYISRSISNKLQSLLEENNFELESSKEDIKVNIYVRKPGA